MNGKSEKATSVRKFFDIYEMLQPGVKIVALNNEDVVMEFEKIETKGENLGDIVCRGGTVIGSGMAFDWMYDGKKCGYKIVSD